MIVNTHQHEAWNGYEGRHWAERYDRFDAVNGGFNHHVLDLLRPGDRVLDVGCGAGQLTRLAAGRTAHATGLDLSAPMLARARTRAEAEDVPNVTFEQGDAQVHPLPAGAFDVAISRFGVMFFVDPVSAFANIGRALRPGGRVAFVAMAAISDHDLADVFASLGTPAPTGADGTGPTSLSDPARVHALLTAAGFDAPACARVDAEQVWGRDAADAAAFFLEWGPVRHALRDASPEATAEARRAATEALGRYESNGAVRLTGAAWLITATRP
ncbi:class I SAM-dependent methyltransferase [Actinomadura flavalba]|uniref:class I SAM-dependent methyltransferase n=1 Tax=Actinomadura flavalba TaxID=1120938 RepID=UPI00037C6236|nr:class I SAM-dependent methyltransferase [Actinomadura flavalba]